MLQSHYLQRELVSQGSSVAWKSSEPPEPQLWLLALAVLEREAKDQAELVRL